MRLGNNNVESTVFNSRLQPTEIALKSSTGADMLKINYAYNNRAQKGNNGNVLQQTISVPAIDANAPFIATQNYTYDSLNRLKSATEAISSSETWKQTFLYDRYGNRNFDQANTTTLTKNCQSGGAPIVCAGDVPIYDPTIDTAKNRLNGYTYDNAGNTTKDAQSRKFIYDAENKQTKVQTVDANGNVTSTVGEYAYDGDGKRVKKVVGAETTIFVYDASGRMIAEYSTVVASAADAKVSYLTADNLGSPRITTDANGGVISRRDFMPFGEEVARASYGTDTVRQKFTSYERDIESSLDFAQARYHNSSVGRFTSPDPMMASARRANPQTWNRYSYVNNNPLNFVDPLGLEGCDPKKDKNCAEQGPNGTSVLLGNGGTPAVIGSVTIVASQAAEVITTTATQISTQIIPRALESLPSMSSVLTGVGRLASVPGMILTMPTTVNPYPECGTLCHAKEEAGTTAIPTTADPPDRDTGDVLYRGVTAGHPGYNEALLGIARPRGGTATPAQHNEDEDTRSPYTSWTRSYGIANYWANRSTAGGIILSARIPRSRQVTSPDSYREQEVLVTGVVTGANVTLIKPR